VSDAAVQPGALHLLSLAKTIRHYEEALTKANGEDFNIFHILRVAHLEVTTHSPILAELLNPRGSHGQGAVFLRHFLDVVNLQDFAAESARVETEVSIGALGRIDIVINDGNHRSIFIENKIHAGLQEDQLVRYHEHDRNADLLFLTLEPELPADWPTNPGYTAQSFTRAFRNISYRTDILQWLERCRKEVATAPTVREAITQYIYLVQHLTQQNTSARMNQEIVKAVTHDSSTYLAYASLRNASGEIRSAIIAKVNAQLEALAKELGLTPLEAFTGQGKSANNSIYTTPAMKARNLRFGLRFADTDYRNLGFGFAYIDCNLKTPLDSPVIALFKEAFPEPSFSNGFWHAYAWWDHHRNWGDEVMAAILNGQFAPDLDALIRKLAKVATDAAKPSTINSQPSTTP
jgi:hypothetical protein